MGVQKEGLGRDSCVIFYLSISPSSPTNPFLLRGREAKMSLLFLWPFLTTEGRGGESVGKLTQ